MSLQFGYATPHPPPRAPASVQDISLKSTISAARMPTAHRYDRQAGLVWQCGYFQIQLLHQDYIP